MKKERAQDNISSYPFSLLCKTVQNVIPAKEVKQHFFVSNTLDYFIVITTVEHLPPCLQYI